MPTKRVLIVGAGPAGLVSLKTLLHFPPSASQLQHSTFDPILLDATGGIGGTFAHRSYENGTLVSSKQLTAFSDYRFRHSEPDHVSMASYVAYLKRYVTLFGLDTSVGSAWAGTPFEKVGSRIQLRTTVVNLEKLDIGRHLVTFQTESGEEQTVEVDAVSICTGLHVIPSIPFLPGLENLVPQDPPFIASEDLPKAPPGMEDLVLKEGVRVIHSSQYKHRSEFAGRKVMILGCGESSMDLSYEAIQAGAKEVVVCHRGGFLSFPKVLNDFQVLGVTFDVNLPIDGIDTNLFETAYVHPWVLASHIRWFISDFIIRRALWVLTGTEAGCNQWVGSLPPERLGRAYVFLNKSTKAMQYINKPYRPKSTFFRTLLRTGYLEPPDPFPSSYIDLAPFPLSVAFSGRVLFPPLPTPEGKTMSNPKKVIKPDLVVFATGYRQEWGWLGPAYPRGPGDERVNVREVCESSDVSVAYIGFLRPGVGAIPPIAEMQAQFWALLLTEQIPVPTSEPTYRLLASTTARIQYGVDYSTYVSTLAKDMGSAPSLWQLYWNHGWHVLLTYCFGAAFPSFYRLEGPFKSSLMDDIVTTELWETIARREFAGHLFISVIPVAFYAIVNLLAWILEQLWNLSGRPDPPQWLKERYKQVGPKKKSAPLVNGVEKKVRWAGT